MKDTMWVWGRHPVLESVRSGRALRVLIAEGRRSSPILDEIRTTAHASGVAVVQVPPGEIDRLAPGQSTQGVAAELETRRAESLRDLLVTLPVDAPAFLLVLDQIQDPHNVGALLRSAEAAGVQGIIVPNRRSAPLSGVVVKTSAGAINHLSVVEVTNVSRALDEVRSQGIWTVGLDGSAATSIFDTDFRLPTAIVVGSEGSGLRRLTKQYCDLVVHIPMLGSIESLNVSVAGSIAMYEVVRQRLARP